MQDKAVITRMPMPGLLSSFWPSDATLALRRGDVPAVLRAVLAVPLVRAFGRFLAVGCAGLAVDASLFAILDARHIAPEISRALSIGLATFVTWQLNRHFTFDPSHRTPHREAMRYALVALMAQGFSYGVFLTLVYGVPVLPRLLSLLIGAGLAAVVGFAGQKLFAFAPARPRPVSKDMDS